MNRQVATLGQSCFKLETTWGGWTPQALSVYPKVTLLVLLSRKARGLLPQKCAKHTPLDYDLWNQWRFVKEFLYPFIITTIL